MAKEEIRKVLRQALLELKKEKGVGDFDMQEISFEHPENPDHGDYATNIAFVLAKRLGRNPREVADRIVSCTKYHVPRTTSIEKIEVAGSGFINFFLSPHWLEEQLLRSWKEKEKVGQNTSLKGKKIMVEYAHPNTHKEMHVGHMRTLITGEALARIFEACGARVFRANYQGDVGPHVAKAIWGIEKIFQERAIPWKQAQKLNVQEKARLLGEGYVRGNQEYEQQKDRIDELNRKLYERAKDTMSIYKKTRTWSLDYFDSIYKRFGTRFDKLYFESEVADRGKKIVLKNRGNIFQESNGAVIFEGEKYGLHTRVFITQDGHPTYEGKEMGLAPMQYKDFPFDLNIHVVASEQSAYFQVVFKALELIDEKFKGRECHLSMGMVQLVGKKMSSRTGVVITIDHLLSEIKTLLSRLIKNEGLTPAEQKRIQEIGAIAAVKYSMLRVDPKADVMFDLKSSVSLEGDSGPYLLYTYARCKSILRKAKFRISNVGFRSHKEHFSKEELDILRLAYRFEEIVREAAEKFAPNLVCGFAFDLAQTYNTFYHSHSVLQAETKEKQEFRLLLTAAVAQVISNSLSLLGIQTLEKM